MVASPFSGPTYSTGWWFHPQKIQGEKKGIFIISGMEEPKPDMIRYAP